MAMPPCRCSVLHQGKNVRQKAMAAVRLWNRPGHGFAPDRIRSFFNRHDKAQLKAGTAQDKLACVRGTGPLRATHPWISALFALRARATTASPTALCGGC